MDKAKGIEGLIRQPGVHAAGVIMSAETITDYIPVWTRHADGAVITQFDYPTCEGLGLLKMDFLGLRNLTIMADAVAAIEKNRGTKIDLLSLPLDNRPAYDLLSRGDTLGVFQLDGGPMRSLLRLMKPDNFEDISAVLALYRPGPMGVNSHTNYALRKNGLQDITPIHPELEEPLREILEPTYGLIVYQEQVQKAAQILAGYSLGQADLLRRAMGKKKKEILDKEFVPFQQGCRERGYSDKAIQAVWDVLVPFSGYAFNKAHTAGYGLVSYWTAYLKANYPAEYMAALLTSVGDDKDKSALYLSESRRMHIKVLPPDVNESVATFTAVGEDVRFGLAAIRNVGVNVVEAIVATRKSKGAFTSFSDFLRKVPHGGLQQAGRRVAHQGRRVRLLRSPAQGPGHGARAGRGLGDRHQAQRGHRPGLAVRRGRGDRGVLRRADPRRRRLGQGDPAQLRARDARAVRLRPPAAGRGAPAGPGGRLLAGRPDRAEEADDQPRSRGGRDGGQVVKVAGILSGSSAR